MSFGTKSQKIDFLRLALTLFAITALVAVMLALANYFTAPIILASAQERLNNSLNSLMADAVSFELVEEYEPQVNLGSVKVSVPAVYSAVDANGQSIGYCVRVTPVGYSDLIEMIVAINGEGAVSGVQILSIADTPGIGMKVQTDEEFQKSVYGITDVVKIVKTAPSNKSEVQVISGATISSTAYINGVNAAVEVVQNLKAEVQ